MAVRQLLFFAVLATVVLLSEAFPLTPITVKLADRFTEIHRALRQRRQSSNCMKDMMEANTTSFRACLSVLYNIGPGQSDNATLQQFCDNNCSNHLVDVINRLKHDCGNSEGLPDPSEIGEFLNQSCKHGVRNTYCVELWNGLFDPHGSFVSVRQDYTDCVQVFNPTSFACPNSCKTVEQWVLTNVGCCYRVPMDYGEPEALGTPYWEKCGFKRPALCTT